MTELLNSQGLLTCPICRKEFKPNDDTKYIIADGYTCSWKCFWTESQRRSKEKKEAEKRKNDLKNDKNNKK